MGAYRPPGCVGFLGVGKTAKEVMFLTRPGRMLPRRGWTCKPSQGVGFLGVGKTAKEVMFLTRPGRMLPRRR